MHSLFRSIALVTLLLFFTPLLAANKSPVGVWKSNDDETGQPKALIEISEHAGVLEGKIIKLFRNPDEEQDPLCAKCKGEHHDEHVLGMTILTGLKKDADEWNGGEILDPNNGKIYRCKIGLIENGAKLDVRGFIGISLLGRTQVWERQQ